MEIIIEDIGTGRRYNEISKGVYEEIDSTDEKHYKGIPVSHGYVYMCTMENVLWADGLNKEPTIEDMLMEEVQPK